jgi:hypothetical protein
MLVGKTLEGGCRHEARGGLNEVIIPSGDRTNPWTPLLSLYEPVIAPLSLMLDAGVSELNRIPFITGKTVTKVPGTSKDSNVSPGRRTKPKVRPLATV